MKADHYYRGVAVYGVQRPGYMDIWWVARAVRCRLGCCNWLSASRDLRGIRAHIDAALAEPHA
jgi:hypothetical protein